jgi:phosphoglycerol transferase MdoB-like AlkP superfamily enzyme
MYFKFNQSKKPRALRNLFATFLSFTSSIMISVLCYAITNLFVCFLNIDLDITSIKYILVFVLLFALILLSFVLIYAFTKKGVVIDENLIVIKVGFFDNSSVFYKSNIPIDDVVSIEYMQGYKSKEVLKDYKNYNYSWISVGMFCKNTPVAKVLLNNDIIYLIPLEDINTFIKTFNNYKNAKCSKS